MLTHQEEEEHTVGIISREHFNPASGINSIHDDDVKDMVYKLMRNKLDYIPDVVEFGHMAEFRASAKAPAVMQELLENPELLNALEKRLEELGLNGLIKFYSCGEESMVFTLETDDLVSASYIFRISQAYNRSVDHDKDDLPSPMVKPVYHEILQGGKHGIRIMIVPKMEELRASDRTPWMRAHRQAMEKLGYHMDDTGPQNFLTVPGDMTLTPFCVDFGVYDERKPRNEKDAQAIKEAREIDAKDGIRGSQVYYSGTFIPAREWKGSGELHWKGKLEKAFPIFKIKSPQERLRRVIAEILNQPSRSVKRVSSKPEDNIQVFE